MKIKTPYYGIIKCRNSVYNVMFVYGNFRVDLGLSEKEWKHLLHFLKLTRKRPPKDKIGYSGLYIETGEVQYVSSKSLMKTITKLGIVDSDNWENDIRKDTQKVNKTFLKDTIFLFRFKPTIFIFLARNDFIQFRKVCLNPKNILAI